MGGCLSQYTAAALEPEPQVPQASVHMNRIASNPLRSSRSPRYINAAYWPQWLAYHERLPTTFENTLSKISHIFFAFAYIDCFGNVRLADPYLSNDPLAALASNNLRAWTQLKSQHPHLKVILSIAKETNYRALTFQGLERFAASAREILQLYNLDGIDINWDPNTYEEGLQLLQMVKITRKTFQRASRLLIMPTTLSILATFRADYDLLARIPLAALAKELDLVNLMAYDFVNGQSQRTGHHAQLIAGREGELSCEGFVNYVKNERAVPANKILLGVPLYGRSFLGADGPYQNFNDTGGFHGIHEVRNLPRPEAAEKYEENLGAAWCGRKSPREFVSYDNADSVFDKAWYARDMGLAGLFYWHIGYDRVGEKSLIAKGWETLNEARGGHS